MRPIISWCCLVLRRSSPPPATPLWIGFEDEYVALIKREAHEHIADVLNGQKAGS